MLVTNFHGRLGPFFMKPRNHVTRVWIALSFRILIFVFSFFYSRGLFLFVSYYTLTL